MQRVFNVTTSKEMALDTGMSFPIASSLSASGAGYTLQVMGFNRVAVQATGTTTAGTFSCVALVKVSIDGSSYITAGTISLNGASGVTDGFVITAPWNRFKCSLSTIGGTNAVLNVVAAV